MLTFLILASAFLAIVDAALTYERVGRYGVEVELNKPLRKAMAKFGRLPGLLLAHGAPNAIVLTALLLAGASHLAAFWLGLKFSLFILQLKSYLLEIELAGLTTRSAL